MTVICGSALAQVNVTTFQNNNARTGLNQNETTLTLANVNSTQFGARFSVTVDGVVYSQPLYLSGVSIAGGTHNVLYVATEHNSVFAIDAESGTVYAKVSLLPTGGTTINSRTDLGCYDVVSEVGITGTPVIDPVAGILYVVAKSKVNGSAVQYLHALNVANLQEALGGPVEIQATFPGSDSYGSDGTVVFNSLQEFQRSALLLDNGHVVISWGSHCDHDPWHGWVMSYNSTALAQEAVFNSSPNGERNGIWMSGGGPSADAEGNIYFTTGNGTWNGTTDLGDSIVKLGPPVDNAFPLLDYFTPFDQSHFAADDLDVSSAGLVLLPPLASGTQLLAQEGKSGRIYLLNTTTGDMGEYCVNATTNPCTVNGTTDPQITQEIPNQSVGVWGSPAYWNGNLYWAPVNEPMKAYSFNAGSNGLISTAPTSETTQKFAFAAPTPAISSNGTTNGILWALDGSARNSECVSGSTCLGLYAYDATNLGNLLYSSAQAPNNRDYPGTAAKYEVPTIANGMVYVGVVDVVTAYGLLPGVQGNPPLLTGMTLVGNAALSGGALKLTSGVSKQNAAAWWPDPLTVTAFTTNFTFQITPASPSLAHGMTFTIQSQPPTPLKRLGISGQGLGYQGITDSVAVKFDVFNSGGIGANSTGFYVNGAAPTSPAINLTPSGINLHSGDVMNANLTYNGTTLTLTLTDTVTNASFTASDTLNIPAIVRGATAYVGFTGATGGSAAATQEILSWTYAPN